MEKLSQISKVISLPDEAEMITETIAQLILDHKLNCAQVIDSIKKKLVLKQLENNVTQGKIIAEHNISRRQIRNYKTSNASITKTNKIDKVFALVSHIIDKYCRQNNVESMPKHTFYLELSTYIDGETSMKDFVEVFKEYGVFIESDTHVHIQHQKSIKHASDKLTLNYISLGIKRAYNTMRYNQSVEHTLYEMAVRSTQIHPKNSDDCREAINEVLRNSYTQIFNILTSFEDDVEPGTYPEIGSWLLHFNENCKTN